MIFLKPLERTPTCSTSHDVREEETENEYKKIYLDNVCCIALSEISLEWASGWMNKPMETAIVKGYHFTR